MNLSDERRLIEQIATEPEAFGQLFDAYYLPILKYCVKRTGDVAVGQDIAAQTFLKAYQSIRRFKWQGVSICNWFYKIATNELRTYYSRAAYQPRSLEELRELYDIEPASQIRLEQELIDAQAGLERYQQYLAAREALATLPEKYQEVICLRFIEQKKLSEIAYILGKSENTIKTRLYRGLAALRHSLATQQPTKLLSPSPVITHEGQAPKEHPKPYERPRAA